MKKTVIVVPCYNEFKRLPVDAFKEFVSDHDWCRFVFVDDGSTDATGDLIEDLRAFDPAFFRTLRLGPNFGKGEAVRRGLLAALEERPNYVGYWDADLATPLDTIP